MQKNDVYKNGYRRRSCTSKTAKIHRIVRFVMYCIITTCSVECYWQCSDDTVSVRFVGGGWRGLTPPPLVEDDPHTGD